MTVLFCDISDSGKYLTTAPSKAKSYPASVTLKSSTIPHGTGHCLTFWYNFHGSDSSFKVFVVSSKDGKETILDARVSFAGFADVWLKQGVDISDLGYPSYVRI